MIVTSYSPFFSFLFFWGGGRELHHVLIIDSLEYSLFFIHLVIPL